APALGLREGPRLDDADHVADSGGVRLVVGVQLARAPDDLLVLGVDPDRLDLDHDRLVALVGDDYAAALLAPAGSRLGLGGARDRLALLERGARRLRVLVTQGARQPFALRGRGRSLRLRLGRGLGVGFALGGRLL